VGEVMAAYMLSRPGLWYTTATIRAGNTATIHNARNQTPRGAHYLVNEVHRWMELAMERGPPDREIGLVWTPGHVGVEGNEKADEHAKKAAKGDSSAASSLPRLLWKPLPISRSAVRKTYKAMTKVIISKRMDTAKHLRKI
jgi:hypothetical protein